MTQKPHYSEHPVFMNSPAQTAIYIYCIVFIHSATNVTLDITFTSYITFLTYKHY